jgi:hypothetical protein
MKEGIIKLEPQLDKEVEINSFEGNIEFTSTSITEFEFNKVEEVKRTIYKHSFSMRIKHRAKRPGPVVWLIKDGKIVTDIKGENNERDKSKKIKKTGCK